MPVDGTLGCLAALALLKQANPHIKTLLSIGGGTGSKEFPAVAVSPSLRAAFARSARQWVDRHSFDGIDSKIGTGLPPSTSLPPD